MLIGIAHLQRVEVLAFFLHILNPLIDIAGNVLADIKALVLLHRHSELRPPGIPDDKLVKDWAIFLHEGIDFSQ